MTVNGAAENDSKIQNEEHQHPATAKRTVLVDSSGVLISSTNKLPVEASIVVEDIEIGAVEIKNSSDDTRTTVETRGSKGVLAVEILNASGNQITSFGGSSTISGTVSVNNFPTTQQVSGTVDINSIPAISGTVSVSGTVGVTGTFWQSTQAVSGTVSATVTGTVDINSIPAISGTVNINSLPAISGTVVVSAIPAISGTVYISGTPIIQGTVNVNSLPAITGTVDVNSIPAITGTVDINSLPTVTATISGTITSTFGTVTSTFGTVTATVGTVTETNSALMLGDLQTINSLVPTKYDYIGLSYSTPTGGNLTEVLYRTGGVSGTIVSTLTLSYTGSTLISVVKT